MRNELLSEERRTQLREAVRDRYRAVSLNPAGHFQYPVGRESTRRLGYEPEWLSAVPDDIVDRFVGIGNPFSIRKPTVGERALDVGCGCGLDAFVAAHFVGSQGHSVGLDSSVEMLSWPRRALIDSPLTNLEFHESSVENLPYDDADYDMVISNGVLNLVPDKDAAFGEIARVLRAGGLLVAADLIARDSIPEEVLASKDAWST